LKLKTENLKLKTRCPSPCFGLFCGGLP
jgi:hypothetical protein